MENPDGKGGLSVTLKQDSKDGTWTVFHGSSPDEIRKNLLAYFGDDLADQADASLFDVVLEATRIYKAAGSVSNGLGGRPAGGGSPAWEKARSGAGKAAEEAPAEPEVNPLLAEIESAADVDALKKLWAANRAEFDADAELMSVWKAKGKALKES